MMCTLNMQPQCFHRGLSITKIQPYRRFNPIPTGAYGRKARFLIPAYAPSASSDMVLPTQLPVLLLRFFLSMIGARDITAVPSPLFMFLPFHLAAQPDVS